jgi:hypothetical protein
MKFLFFKYSKFTFSTGAKSENTTFSPLVPVQSPQEIEEKNSKKMWVLVESEFFDFCGGNF